MRALHAWQNDQHIGVFTEESGIISFAYDSAEDGLPISLSLPRRGGWSSDAPAHFLDNLLPDNPNVREAMRSRLRTESTDPFDLLEGVDATGGLTFTSTENPPAATTTIRRADDDEIANDIDRIGRLRNYWWDEQAPCRFSLGGSQGKFTLTMIDGHWYWPSASLPSTHIVKPSPDSLPELLEVEAATMRLAELCGLPVPEHGILSVEGREAYLVERFDRRIERGRILRVRQEDFQQALGRPAREKYEPTVDDCLDLLLGADPSQGLAWQWMERLAFNVSSADSDAHAKNYSLLLDPETGLRLSPVYDAVATRFWVQFDQELAMPLDEDAQFAEWTDPSHWEALAERHGMDGERAADMARHMAGLALHNMDAALAGCGPAVADRLRTCWTKANESIQPIVPQ